MKNLALARQWYDVGAPTWTDGDGDPVSIVDRIDHTLLGDLWRGIEVERSEHQAQADQYAAIKTGYTFSADTILSDAADAQRVIAQLEYEHLEAAAAERRVWALAVCIS